MKTKRKTICDETFKGIINGKYNYIVHALTANWRKLQNEKYVILRSYYGEQEQKFKIEKIEILTITKMIKIHLKI